MRKEIIGSEIPKEAHRSDNTLVNFLIPEGIKVINSQAFTECEKLETVKIANTVEVIGEHAFSYCTSLTRVTIPASVKSIGEEAFAHCTGLREVVFETSEEGEIKLHNKAFAYSKIENVVITSNMKLGEFVFSSNSSLQSITVSRGVSEIPKGTFSCCTMVKVEIADTVTLIGDNAFQYCVNINRLFIPSSVRDIGVRAFNKSKIEHLELSKGLENIGEKAFKDCKIMSGCLSLPVSVASVGVEAFSSCSLDECVTILNRDIKIGKAAFAGNYLLSKLVLMKGFHLNPDYRLSMKEDIRQYVLGCFYPWLPKLDRVFHKKISAYPIMTEKGQKLFTKFMLLCFYKSGLSEDNRLPIIPIEMSLAILAFTAYSPEFEDYQKINTFESLVL